MSGRVPAVEDAPTIAKRVAELAAERAAQIKCTCRRADDGPIVNSSGCPAHDDKGLAKLAATLPDEHFPEDDWHRLEQEYRGYNFIRAPIEKLADRIAISAINALFDSPFIPRSTETHDRVAAAVREQLCADPIVKPRPAGRG